MFHLSSLWTIRKYDMCALGTRACAHIHTRTICLIIMAWEHSLWYYDVVIAGPSPGIFLSLSISFFAVKAENICVRFTKHNKMILRKRGTLAPTKHNMQWTKEKNKIYNVHVSILEKRHCSELLQIIYVQSNLKCVCVWFSMYICI